jgi:prophage regulatory protein
MKKIYIDLPETAALLTLGETTLQRMVREKEFPPPRQLSGRRVAWLVREVEEWAESRPVSELLPPANTGFRHPKPAIQDAPQGA